MRWLRECLSDTADPPDSTDRVLDAVLPAHADEGRRAGLRRRGRSCGLHGSAGIKQGHCALRACQSFRGCRLVRGRRPRGECRSGRGRGSRGLRRVGRVQRVLGMLGSLTVTKNRHEMEIRASPRPVCPRLGAGDRRGGGRRTILTVARNRPEIEFRFVPASFSVSWPSAAAVKGRCLAAGVRIRFLIRARLAVNQQPWYGVRWSAQEKRPGGQGARAEDQRESRTSLAFSQLARSSHDEWPFVASGCRLCGLQGI